MISQPRRQLVPTYRKTSRFMFDWWFHPHRMSINQQNGTLRNWKLCLTNERTHHFARNDFAKRKLAARNNSSYNISGYAVRLIGIWLLIDAITCHDLLLPELISICIFYSSSNTIARKKNGVRREMKKKKTNVKFVIIRNIWGGEKKINFIIEFKISVGLKILFLILKPNWRGNKFKVLCMS